MTGMKDKQMDKIISKNSCPLCGSERLKAFFEMIDVPVHCNDLWSNRDAAINCPKGDIKLAFCPDCNFIANIAFDPNRLEYTQQYENPLHFSPHFQNYAQSLAKRLVERYNLYEKHIIEIGCGDGYFLALLCKLGNNWGIGFDPAHIEHKKDMALNNQVKIIADYYSEEYKRYKADLIVCRHTLEHIYNPKFFLEMLRRVIGNRVGTQIFFEVPNTQKIFHELSIWDIIYEHCSYFTPSSLAHAFSSSGFQVCELSQEYDDQFLCIHATPENQHLPYFDPRYSNKINSITSDIESFTSNYKNKIETWRSNLEQITKKGQQVVIWGGGSKGVTFLNIFKNSEIEYVVDINPHKLGKYISGTGQRIVKPTFLINYQPDIIIVMNSIYLSEIRKIVNKLELKAKLISV
jgi:2-polyprenyl-3-methyl-5-hydroxy-6-metoxy-1,4-benzoquinol methylase